MVSKLKTLKERKEGKTEEKKGREEERKRGGKREQRAGTVTKCSSTYQSRHKALCYSQNNLVKKKRD